MSFILNGNEISRTGKPFIISEIGHNHQGSLERAKELIDLSKWAGVQCVKFQKKDIDSLYTTKMKNMVYDTPDSFGLTYYEHKKFLEFNESQIGELKNYAEQKGLFFLSTAFDKTSVDLLEHLGVKAYKIGSCDVINAPLIKYIASKGKPIFLSTGASTIEEIDKAVATIKQYHNQFVLFHCVSSYPCEYKHLNLSFIGKLLCRYPDSVVGFSGHESGILAPSIAYMLGATVFEKHFTFDRAAKGTDHKFSLEPQGMRKMVRDLTRIQESIGNGEKKIEVWEQSARKKLGKSLYVNGFVKCGDRISLRNLAVKSPGGTGIEPYELENIIGKTFKRDMMNEEPLTWDCFEWPD